MNYKAAFDRVVVRVDQPVAKTVSGLFLPGATKEECNTAEVLLVGPGKYEKGIFIPTTVKVGDKIMFEKYSGVDVTIDGESVKILKEEDIMLVME